MEALGIFVIIASLILKLKDILEVRNGDERRKRIAIKNNQDYYLDENMNRVRLSDGLIYREGKIGGDYCQYDPRSGRIFRNLSRERLAVVSAQNKEEALRSGKKRYIFDDRENASCHPDGFAGAHWTDINTGEVYVRRSFRGAKLWLNVSSGLYDGFSEGKDTLWKPDDELKRLNSEMSKKSYVYNMTKRGHHGEVYVVYEDSRRCYENKQ